MATTTNYSWTTPDDTALVKDGAAAIRTLGSSVDTTVKNLNPETTLGDISYRSSTANVKTRLGLGTAGQVLQVNSGATAPEWATPSSGGMTLISTTTLTGATVTLSSIPATYRDLQVIIRNARPANDGSLMYMRFNADNGANRHAQRPSTGVSVPFELTEVTIYASGLDNTTSNSLAFIYFPDYANTTTWKIANIASIGTDHNNTAIFDFVKNDFMYNQTGAISSLSFFLDSGNFSAGEILLYGVK